MIDAKSGKKAEKMSPNICQELLNETTATDCLFAMPG